MKRHDNIKDGDGEPHTFFTHENPKDIIGGHFYRGEWWEKEFHPVMKKIMQTCEKDTISLDIGANIGTHAVYMNKFGNIWAFEPQKSAFKVLEANINANQTKFKAKLFKVALSERSSGLFSFSKPDKDHLANNQGGMGISEDGGGEKVETISFDKIWERNGKPKVCFVKMDIEGHELQAIKGMTRFLREMSPIFMFEDFYDSREGKPSPVFEFLQRRGYVIKKTHTAADFLAIPSKRKNEFKEYVDYVYDPVQVKKNRAAWLVKAKELGIKVKEEKETGKPTIKCTGDPDEFYYAVGVSLAAALLFFVPQKFPSVFFKFLFGFIGLALTVPILLRMQDFWEFACVTTKLFVLGSILLHVFMIFVSLNFFDFAHMKAWPAFLFMIQLIILVEVMVSSSKAS